MTCVATHAIVFGVYNNGAVYRFETSQQPKVIINTETIE
ncbi:glycoside hydrolase family 97 N-terminal domain-containing protein [Bacteroides ovatus]|nr:glycoside hydrolase family 97 N-terminal domain-containing protein [Bacteroides ovatus]